MAGPVSVMDPAYRPPDDARLATIGALRGLLDASPVGAGDLLHQVVGGQSPMTMPGVISGLLGVPKTPPPGETIADLLGIGGSGPAYDTGRATTNAALAGLLGILARAVPPRVAATSAAGQSGAIYPDGKRKFAAALEEGRLDQPFVIGTLEPRAMAYTQRRRAREGMPPLSRPDLLVGDADIRHLRKRIDVDGLTGDELARMAEEVLAPGAVARYGQHGLVNLWGSRPMQFQPGHPFRPMGILTDQAGGDGPHLYGLIPKGWEGR
jgi:hypothetical protein